MVPNLKPHSVVVIDNAPYHNVLVEKIPNSATRKADIQQWLADKQIAFDKALLKVELLELVKLNRPDVKYVIDEIFEKAGHNVLRLPPYHPVLNPIENIWGIVKGRVAKRNVNQNINGIKILAEEEFKKVTIDEWRNTCRY